MRILLKRILSVSAALALVSSLAIAQGGVTVTGRVTTTSGAPLPGTNVFIVGMNVGTQSGDDGRYSFTVGSARATGQTVTLTARVIGYTARSAQITLARGTTVSQDFVLAVNPLRLGEVVVTGAGTTTTRERLATTINTVDSSTIRKATQPQNIVSALAGTAPNVEVRTQSGDPGASASVKIRGASSLTGTNQPLFVVDGSPIDNTTEATGLDNTGASALGGTVTQNRAADINPNDIESIEILKGSAASAIYGARAANGVVLISTKRGRSGAPRWNISSTSTFDNVQKSIGLQRIYGFGSAGVNATCDAASGPMVTAKATTPPVDCQPVAPTIAGNIAAVNGSWGALIDPALQNVYNHEEEIYDVGHTYDNNVAVSGGSDRTTFYASGGLTNQDGTVVGPNNKYNRLSVRAKGSQQVTSGFNIGANFNYIDSRGKFVQKGSNTSGLLLGALRTPPDFNNKPTYNAQGIERPYRFPNPSSTTSLANSAGYYDNPFFIADNTGNRSELGRAISNVNMDWDPLSWLNVKYTLGADYYNDWRLEAVPIGGASDAVGNVTRNDYNNLLVDHNLLVAGKHSFSDNIDGTLTLGQNLTSERNRSTFLFGEQLIAPLPYSINNTVTWAPQEARSLTHVAAYFGQAELALYNQLYLTAALRNDGFSTFGASNRRSNYPKASVAWTFTNFLGNTEQRGILSFGKARLAYGETGKEPPVYASVPGFSLVNVFGSGYGDVLHASQSGQPGVSSLLIIFNPNLKPERQKEFEGGLDLGFFDQRADLSITAYNKRSSDVILSVPVNGSQTGAFQKYENGAKLTNKGIEATLNVRPIQSQDVDWNVGIQYGRNKGRVDNLIGAQFVTYNVEGFTGSIGSSTIGFPPGVIRGSDFARCGRGLNLVVDGMVADNPDGTVNIDAHCGNAATGALFLGPNGQPVVDPTDRVIADPNPKYTMSFNTSVKVFQRFTLSALVDMRRGGQVWNGTRGALNRFGVSAESQVRSRSGTFGRDFYTDVYPVVAGPGVGVAAFNTPSDWQAWFQGEGGSAGTTQLQFVENGNFVKFRELSLTYSVDPRLIRNLIGFSSADIRIAGRNLRTWTKYRGLDPESNLQGSETLTQGIDFFNNPQTRSFVIAVSLNR